MSSSVTENVEVGSVEQVEEVSVEETEEQRLLNRIELDMEESFNYCYKFYSEVSEEGFNKSYRKMRKEKKDIDNLLGLTLENNYRKTLEVPYADTEYRDNFPRTYQFVEKLADGKVFSISENKIELGTNKFQKLSRYLSSIICDYDKYRNLDGSFDDDGNLVPNTLEVPEFYSDYGNCRNELHHPKDLVSNIIEKSKGNKVCISTNIKDFFTSSTNTAYSSCYQVGGAYFSGNMCNMIDKWTVITFTYSDDIKYKVGRNWFHIILDEGKIMHPSRTYGTMFKREQKIIREFMEERLSEVLEVENKWKVKYNDVCLSTSCVYFDGGNTVLAVNKEFAEKNNVGHNHPELNFPEPYCLKCGDTHENSSSGLCDECDDSNTCYHCGGRYDTDDMYVEGGDYYCSDCHSDHFTYCEHCEEYYWNDDVIYIERHDHYACSNCYDRYYTQCSKCGESIENDDAVEVNGDTYCSDCADDKGYYACEECGENVWCDDTVTVNNKEYCTDCVDGKITECEDCGDMFFDKDITEHSNGKFYCDNCLPEEDSEEKEEENETL